MTGDHALDNYFCWADAWVSAYSTEPSTPTMDTIVVICEFPILVQSTTDAEGAEDHESASQCTLCTDMVPFLVWLLSWHRMQSPLSASGAPFEHFPDGKPVDMFRMEFRSIFIRTSLLDASLLSPSSWMDGHPMEEQEWWSLKYVKMLPPPPAIILGA